MIVTGDPPGFMTCDLPECKMKAVSVVTSDVEERNSPSPRFIFSSVVSLEILLLSFGHIGRFSLMFHYHRISLPNLQSFAGFSDWMTHSSLS